MRKNIATRTMISVLTCSILFSGCGTTEKKKEAENAKEKVSLSLWGAEEDHDILQKMVDNFKAKYQEQADIEVTISAESELTCKNTVLSNPEGAADVFTFADDQLDELVNAKTLLPITEEKEATIEACGGKDSPAIEAASNGGELYAYPATSSNGYFLFYDSKYLKAEDVESFDKLLDAVNRKGKKVSMDFTSGWYTYAFFKGAGLDVYKDPSTGLNVCNWNATDTKYTGVDVLNSMLKIATNKGFISVVDEDFVKGIKDGTIIAGVSGTWNVNVVKEKFGDGYAATKLPTFTVKGDQVQMHSVVGYKEVGVSAHSKNPVWAQRLAAWITNEENQELRFKERGEAPANKNAVQSEDVQNSPAIAALTSQAEFGHIQRVSESFWVPSCRLGTVILASNPKNKDLQELLDETVEKIKSPVTKKDDETE